MLYAVFKKRCGMPTAVVKQTVVDERSQLVRLMKRSASSIENVIEREQLSKNSKFDEVIADNKLLIIAAINRLTIDD